ncbi:MAG TPA: trehalase family glycosidase [Bacteroidota bacterium]|nr:trehalase family glycosidase [Bacteroidota bacterium]
MKNFTYQRLLTTVIAVLLTAGMSSARDKDSYGADVMNGLSNHGANLNKPYLTPGDRTYIVGTQDGNFPDLGWHVKGEMGGVWRGPIKLLDGFWARVTNVESGVSTWLDSAKEFIVYPFGSKFLYEPILDGVRVERFQFCPQGKEGVVITYAITNETGRRRTLDLEFTVKTDISPVWFSNENNISDAADSIFWNARRSVFTARDVKNPWFAVWGSTIPAVTHSIDVPTPIATIGMGKSASTIHRLTINPRKTKSVVFVVAGSDKSLDSALTTFDAIAQNHDRMLSQKKAYYLSIIKRAMINIPDKKLKEAFVWGKINAEWLVSDLPGIGRFEGAGAVEYPWLFGCDNSYAEQGIVATGDMDLPRSTLRTIKEVSEKANGNGRIIHEMSANGFVFNKGNTQETPHFAVAVWKVFEWTGDVKFLKDMYPYIKQGIHWLLTEQDQNGDKFPEGYGIMEVKGLNAELIDVAVYTEQDLEVASKMAAILGEPEVSKDYVQKAVQLKEKINTLFWDETEGSYCDFYGTREQAISATNGTIEQIRMGMKNGEDSLEAEKRITQYKELLRRFEKFPEGTSKGWITNANWVISTPMETGIAPKDKAIRLLNKVRNEHTGEYGPYLSGLEKQTMMTISTGVQAMAEARYGRTDEALWYIDRIVQTFGRLMPGSIAEVMPDMGCPVQAWTIYGLAVPLVTHIFGIEPHAYVNAITLSPHLPSTWNSISISDLPVGSTIISFTVKKSTAGSEYHLASKQADWNFTLHLEGLRGRSYVLNGTTSKAESDDIPLRGRENTIVVMNQR